MDIIRKPPFFDVPKKDAELVKKAAKWELREKQYKKLAERLAEDLITLDYFSRLNTEEALANYFFEEEKAKEEGFLKRGFSSSSLEFTTLLVCHLIKNAKKEIKIFTCCFSSDSIFKDPRTQETINNAVKRGVKFKVLFEENDNRCYLPYGLFEIMRILKKGSELKNHFMISDNCGFRIEKKGGNIRRGYYSIKSETSFNYPEVVKALNEIFSKYYNNDTIKS